MPNIDSAVDCEAIIATICAPDQDVDLVGNCITALDQIAICNQQCPAGVKVSQKLILIFNRERWFLALVCVSASSRTTWAKFAIQSARQVFRSRLWTLTACLLWQTQMAQRAKLIPASRYFICLTCFKNSRLLGWFQVPGSKHLRCCVCRNGLW